MTFSGDVVVRQVDDVHFELVQPLGYSGNQDTFTVPAGFTTDLATVPRAVVWLLPRHGVYTKAAVLHDWLLTSAVVSRRDADGLFRRAMRELDVPVPRRWTMWAAVRLASRLSDATAGELAMVLAITLVALPLVGPPAVVVQLFLLFAWLVEGAFWLGGRLLGRPTCEPVHPGVT